MALQVPKPKGLGFTCYFWFFQREMLTLMGAETAPTLYLVQLAVELLGELNTPAMQAAWQHVLDRHPALRAIPVTHYGLLLQAVCNQVALPWLHQDLTHMEAPQQQAQVARLLGRDRQRGFRPIAAPLPRVSIIQTGAARQLLVFTSHHFRE